MNPIKIHGLMRSGTNFLEFLILRNFDVIPLVNQHAWKHGHIKKDLEANTIIIFKEPFSWLYSIYTYSNRKNKINIFPATKGFDFKKFIRSKFVYKDRPNKIPQFEELNPVFLWNKMHESWLFCDTAGKKIFIKYDSLLLQTEDVLKKIAEKFNMKLKSPTIVFPSENINPDKAAKIREVNSMQYKDENFHSKKQYMKYFDEDDIKFVEENLNANVLAELTSLDKNN